MLLRIILLFFLLGCFGNGFLFSQDLSKYYIFLKDKKGVHFDPESYFDTSALKRRIKCKLSLEDTSDFPLKAEYVDLISKKVNQILVQSRWLNLLVVMADPDVEQELSALSFVRNVEKVSPNRVNLCLKSDSNFEYDSLNKRSLTLLHGQTSRMKGDIFRDKKLDGRNVKIAIFDAGFPNVNKHPAFEHIRKEKRILNTYDFVTSKANVYNYSEHGSLVMSCVSGFYNGIPMGLAPAAYFLLARTEKSSSERIGEEENWLAAAEWADKNGADIINSSLGYTFHRYFYEDMDGKTSLVTQAAAMAVRKGILVVNAAGNEGDTDWTYIGAPADADSVLTVGGTSPIADYKIDFSSYGPTADNRLKPNVCAYGVAIAASKIGYERAPGTSFSAPLVTGFAACLMQQYPDLTNMEIFRLIEQSGHLYPYFDYVHGYGIPQADLALKIRTPLKRPTLKIILKENTALVEIDKEVLAKNQHPLNLYFHIEGDNKFLSQYGIMRVDYHIRPYSVVGENGEKKTYDFTNMEIMDNIGKYAKKKLVIHFEGYTTSVNL